MHFPEQMLSTAEKKREYGSIKDYCLKMAEAIRKASMLSNQSARDIYELQVLHKLSRGEWDPEDAELDKTVKAYGDGNYTFPAEFDHKDRITPVLRLLYGEELKRPFNWRVVNKAPDGLNTFMDQKKSRIMEVGAQLLEMAVQGEEVDERMQQELSSVLSMDLQDMKEKMGNDALRYLKYFLDLPDIFAQGWEDLLVYSTEIYHTGIRNGEPHIRPVDRRFFDYERFPNQRFIEESGWWVEWRYLPASQVHDEFYDDLDTDNMRDIDQLQGTTNAKIGNFDGNRVPIIYQDMNTVSGDGVFNDNGSTLLRVANYYWVGKQKVQFVTGTDPETGEYYEDFQDEDYKPEKHEEVETRWLNQLWECTIIGNDICVRYRPHPVTAASIENPNKILSPYSGISINYSLVKVLKPLQYLYNRIWGRMELMIARAKGKGFIMDVAQIPKSMGFDVQKWLYYLDVMGVGFINSFEEGKKGASTGRLPQFNQFQTFDMTLSQALGEMIAVLEKIEQQMGYVSGVTEQRLGQIQTSELVNNVKRSVVQSSHITESLFHAHNVAKRKAIENLLEYAKIAWQEGKKSQYILPDLSRAVLNIDEGFADAEYGLFVSNSSRDDEIMENIKQLSQAAVQAGTATISDVLKVMKSDSIADAERILDMAEQKAQQMQREQGQMQQQVEQQRMEEEAYHKDADRENDYKIAYMQTQAQLRQAILNNDTKEDTEMRKIAAEAERAAMENAREDKRMQHEKTIKDKEMQLKEQELKVKRMQARKAASKPK